MKITIIAAVVCLIGGCAQMERVASPPEQNGQLELVRDILDQWNDAWWTEESTERMQEVAQRSVEGLQLDQLGGVHLGVLLSHHSMSEWAGVREAALQRMKEFLDDPGPDGAAAASFLLSERLQVVGDVNDKARIYRKTFRHGALLEAVRLGGASRILQRAMPDDPELLRLVAEDILSLERLLVPETAEELAFSFDWYFRTLNAIDEAGYDVDVQRLRQRMVELARGALPNITYPRRQEYLRNVIAFLDGAAARGELVGHPAPPIELIWSSDSRISSLNDLRGRVVVLEFWATWCGPCIANIPKMQGLVKRYAEEPLTVLGVCEVEPYFVTAEAETIRVGDDTQRLFELMREYMTDKDITWPIGFINQVVQAEFGVRGIPSIVIIDANGVVRNIGLHPAQEEELRDRIDALLEEMPSSAN